MLPRIIRLAINGAAVALVSYGTGMKPTKAAALAAAFSVLSFDVGYAPDSAPTESGAMPEPTPAIVAAHGYL